MKFKTFKQFLAEAPFNDDKDYSHLNTTGDDSKGKEYGDGYASIADKYVDKFYETFKILGSGSSRVAFLAPINFHVFKASDQKDLTVKDTGQVDTVFKVALNNKGIFQNKVELQVWNQVKGSSMARYLCPIIDWCGNEKYNNNIQYQINDKSFTQKGKESAPFWVQMPLVQMTRYDKMNEVVIKEFGFGGDLYDVTRISDKNLNQKHNRNEITQQQYNNVLTLQDMLKYFEITDLHSGNIGLYQGRPVILDYGFDSSTNEIYCGKSSDKLSVRIDEEGHPVISFGGSNDNKIPSRRFDSLAASSHS